MSSPIVLILGAGSNIGLHVARAFASQGYRIAISSRQKREETSQEGYTHFEGDLSNPSSVAGIFQQVRQNLGHPSVVVYNAAAATFNNAQDPLSTSIADLTRDLNINTISVLAAAHEATVSFAELPSTASKTFIYTGNRLNIAPIAPLLTLGIGKSGTAHMIASASQSYKDQGYRFYYADERKADGSPIGQAISGEAAAQFYPDLAKGVAGVPWLATFVKGSGYVKFE